ncbi:MAG: DUF2723 domain-containing protein [Deltaproteobacteria bacterium]|nr:DUF2723 domain-containing protein [Deltaproteobacteria bacterium]
MDEPRRTLHGGYVLLVVGMLAVYLPTLARGVTFTDGPEIVTGIYTLGVLHPTGYPIFTMLGHAFCRLVALPLLPGVKVELFNALCALGAALLTARATSDLVQEARGLSPRGDRREADLCGLCAGALLGLSPLLWNQVRIPEVYPLELLLVTCAGYAWVRFELTRELTYVVLAALPMGMGLAHHVTTVYMLPAAFLYLLVRRPFFFVAWLAYPLARLVRLFRPGFMARADFRRWWAFPAACAVGFLPLLSYYYLIWANAHTTGIPWGGVDSWQKLVDHATGKQYQGFMKLKALADYWRRIKALPAVFDQQFLPLGTLLFFTGIAVAFRRRWRFALFLLLYLLFNVFHGVYYSVGDYANYFLPALLSCTIFIAFGLWGARGWAARRRPQDRRWLGWATAAVFLAAYAGTVLFYAKHTNRYARELGRQVPWAVCLPLAVAALGAAVLAWRAFRRRARARPARTWALPALLAGLVLAVQAPATAVRGRELVRKDLVGESYGAELASSILPGSVLMTQGDGFLFTMWYEHHVLGRGTDFVTLDLGNVNTPWYREYVRTRYPTACDPLAAGYQRDPAAYRRKCGSFGQRIALAKRGNSYASLGLQRSASGKEPVRVTLPKKRGDDPHCADKAFRDEKGLFGKECRCYNYGREPGVVEEDCVHSAEDGGIAPRWPEEVRAHRIIEDMIYERPVYERNMFTRWVGDVEENKREWDGPAYLRISGQYELIGRGRFNQVVFYEDASKLADPCGRERLRRLPLRPFVPPRSRRPPRQRERYQPNERPQLITASWLGPHFKPSQDDATREFRAGEAVYVNVDWFEKFQYDARKSGRRGARIRHGVRFCFFDPSGRRVATQTTVSGRDRPAVVLRTGRDWPRGSYTVQACSTGEVGDRTPPLPDGLRCNRFLLEYGFELGEPRD